MFAPITRSMTLTLGLCSAVFSPGLLAETEDREITETSPPPLELGATNVNAESLGSTTENTGSYTTGAMNTATRLKLSVKETPQSISVVTRQQMDDFKLTTLSETMKQVTGISVRNLDSERVGYTSRGYSINNFQVDGMLNTFNRMKSDSDTIIYDRIEVVRGATGLTTGAGDPSGTINMVRKRPTHEWAAKTGVSAGSYDNYASYLDVSGPLAFEGRLRGRTVLAYRDSQSFRDYYHLERSVAYGILEADLTDETVLAVGYDYQDRRVRGSSWGATPYWNASGGKANLSRSTNITAPWSSWPLKDKTTFVTLDQNLAHDWKLKAAYTHRESDTDGKMYYGGAGFPADDGSGMSAWTSHFIGEQEMDVVDFNVAGPFSLFGREHELMAGYGMAKRSESSPFVRGGQTPAGYTTIPDWRDTSDISKFSDEVTHLNGSNGSTRQKAGYLATRLTLTEQLHAVLGTRYGSWEIDSISKDYDLNGNRIDDGVRSRQRHNDVLTPYAGLLYDLTPEYTVYVSYTDIFNPQDDTDFSGKYLEPIVGSNYEVGLKGSLLEERVNLAAAYFWSKQDNLPIEDFSVPPNPETGDPYLKAGGKGNKVQGFEVEVSGEVMPNWNLTAGYTYTHARDPDGKRLDTRDPLNLLKINSTYRLPGEWRGLTVGAGLDWQSDVFSTSTRPISYKGPTESAKIHQDAYAVVNLMSRYAFDRHVSASLNVNNLFDKHYYNNVGFYNGVYWGDPRSVTLGLEWKL